MGRLRISLGILVMTCAAPAAVRIGPFAQAPASCGLARLTLPRRHETAGSGLHFAAWKNGPSAAVLTVRRRLG